MGQAQKTLHIKKNDVEAFTLHMHRLKTELSKIENACVPDDLKTEFVELCHQIINSYDASDTWFNTSITNFEEFVWCGGNQGVMWNGTGYRAVFNILMVIKYKYDADKCDFISF